MRLAVVCVLATSATAAAQSWSPLDDDGWPSGVTLGEVRELHECAPGELDVREGGSIGCRPSIAHSGPQLQFGIDWTSGPVFGSDHTAGGAHALGAEASYALSRSVSLAGRYELMGIAPSMVGAGALNQHFLGLLKYRLFRDEVGRHAWTLGVGGGWAMRPSSLGDDAPIARVSLAREIGAFIDNENAIGAAVEVAYERTLDDDALSALLLSYRFGFELNIREPRNLGKPEPRGSRWRTITGDAYLGNAIGLGMSLGLRANRVLSLETSAGFQFGTSDVSKQHGYTGSSWSIMSGPRVSLPLGMVSPYVQVQAGPAWFSTENGPDVRGLGHAEIGMRLHAGCRAEIDAGFWLRGDLEEREARSGGLLMRIGAGPGPAGAWRCGGSGGTPTFATRPPPPTTVTTDTVATTTSTSISGGGSVSVARPPSASGTVIVAPPSTTVSGGASASGSVIVAPPPTTVVVAPPSVALPPVVLDVELGLAVPGLQVRFDPRMLPIAQMRGVRRVDIELSGPSGALATYQRELAIALGRGGVRVDGWAFAPNGSARVRARITIRP